MTNPVLALTRHLARNAVAYVALFVALGGTAYGAAKFTGADIVDESLVAEDLAPASVGASELADGSVGAGELSSGAVGSAALAANAVGTAHVATVR